MIDAAGLTRARREIQISCRRGRELVLRAQGEGEVSVIINEEESSGSESVVCFGKSAAAMSCDRRKREEEKDEAVALR